MSADARQNVGGRGKRANGQSRDGNCHECQVAAGQSVGKCKRRIDAGQGLERVPPLQIAHVIVSSRAGDSRGQALKHRKPAVVGQGR